MYEFLETNKKEILVLTSKKNEEGGQGVPAADGMNKGLEAFYGYVVEYLKDRGSGAPTEKINASGAAHGQELRRLKFSLAQVVHSYGSMCQAVTEYAQRKNANITPQEFNDLNMCLDLAIAAAVTEFEYRSDKENKDQSELQEVKHLGFLAHELRNALSSAMVAHDMIKQGIAGMGGSTARVLEDNLIRMRHLIDRSLSDVRMRGEPNLHIEKFQLNSLVDQILLTAESQARYKKQILTNELKVEIDLETDRQLLLSAVANLVQNGMKYSKDQGHISVRAALKGDDLILEVADACGGIPPDQEKNLFKSFVSGAKDHSGLGLGLNIVQRAVTLMGGAISVHSNPGTGCVFMLVIPKTFQSVPASSPKANS